MKEHLKTTTSNCFVFCGHILGLFAIHMKSCRPNTIDYIVTEDETEFKIGLCRPIGLSCSVVYYLTYRPNDIFIFGVVFVISFCTLRLVNA